MKRSYWIYTTLIDFLILNLFITITSLPILVAWGLPLSWLSPIGNLIFGPFLSLFLLISTFSFFSALLHLPHLFFDTLLEVITDGWYTLLQLAPINSFIGFSATAQYALWGIALAAFLVVLHVHTPFSRLHILALLFFCSIAVLKATQPTDMFTTLPCVKKEVHLVRTANETILIDEGAFSERTNPASWVQYHLIPDIVRHTGSMHIDHLFLTRPTIRVFEATVSLMQHALVHTIYFPIIEGEMKGSHRGIFRKLYAIAKEKEVTLQRINRERTVKLGPLWASLSLEKKVDYRSIAYCPLSVRWE